MFAKVQKFVRNTAHSEGCKWFGKTAVKVKDGKLQRVRPKIFPGFCPWRTLFLKELNFFFRFSHTDMHVPLGAGRQEQQKYVSECKKSTWSA